MALDNVGAKGEEDVGLSVRIRVDIAVEVDDLDADRLLIQAGHASPSTTAGMICGHIVRHHSDNPGLDLIGHHEVYPHLMIGIATLKGP